MIVGFPGETEEQFQRSLELCEEVRFDAVHVAAFSPRPGTPAGSWPDDVSPDEKLRRLHAIEALQHRVGLEFNQQLVGTETDVLIEELQHFLGRAQWKGRTRQNKIVVMPAEPDGPDRCGHLVRVRVERVTAWSLQAIILGGVRAAEAQLAKPAP